MLLSTRRLGWLRPIAVLARRLQRLHLCLNRGKRFCCCLRRTLQGMPALPRHCAKRRAFPKAFCGSKKAFACRASIFPKAFFRRKKALRINKANGKRLMVADLRSKAVMCGKFSEAEFRHEDCGGLMGFFCFWFRVFV